MEAGSASRYSQGRIRKGAVFFLSRSTMPPRTRIEVGPWCRARMRRQRVRPLAVDGCHCDLHRSLDLVAPALAPRLKLRFPGRRFGEPTTAPTQPRYAPGHGSPGDQHDRGPVHAANPLGTQGEVACSVPVGYRLQLGRYRRADRRHWMRRQSSTAGARQRSSRIDERGWHGRISGVGDA